MFSSRTIKILFLFFIVIFFIGCTHIGKQSLSNLFGLAEPRNREVTQLDAGMVDYWTEVKPVLENRCVVCHSCYDAPCQLKLSSFEGIERGATNSQVYDASRLFEADPTRLFEDAHSVSEWREKKFYPMLNEHTQSIAANKQAGVIHRLLELKETNPLPEGEVLSEEFLFDIDRKLTCPTPDNVDDFEKKHPLWGMPYALPGLTSRESQVIKQWLEEGALHTKRTELSKTLKSTVSSWENFLNQDSLKAQLISRYLYEHLFLAHLYFEGQDNNTFFKMVRSSTAPGEPINIISTRRPYDAPGTSRVFYRLMEYPAAIVAKTHMPYALTPARMERWQNLFFNADYEVSELPDYDPAESANPFSTFSAIPVASRYQFLLDEAQYTVMGFIKGPVCRGQVALNVINDHFWVFFVKPNIEQDTAINEFIEKNSDLLSLPSEQGSTLHPLISWLKYAKKQRQYLKNRDEYLAQKIGSEIPLDLDGLWDGDKTNDNSALTIFRHFDSATVEKGMLGGYPKTAWVLTYVDLERIHYLLVAGYDVYGNVGHQLLSRLYMDFLRMQGESNFLLLLPQKDRVEERNNWYRNASKDVLDYLTSPAIEKANQEPNIQYYSDNKKLELYGMLENKYEAAYPSQKHLKTLKNKSLAQALEPLAKLTGIQISNMPESAVVIIETSKGDEYFTLLKNSAHLNITSMFKESKNLIPEEDTLSLIRGISGSYPNAFFKVAEDEVGKFIAQVEKSSDPSEYEYLMTQYGVRRTHPEFWQFSDRVHKEFRKIDPISYGLLDYNRLENR